jgi:hypothetical protein
VAPPAIKFVDERPLLHKSVLARLKWLGIEEDGFDLLGIVWNEVRRFWSDWNVLEKKKSVLA